MNLSAAPEFTESRSIRRGRIVTMGVSYALGTFNDNFFKQAALLLAVAASQVGVQGLATLLFALPFVAFSAWTGWLADRIPKKRIVVWSKAMEIVAMGVGVWALYALSWPGVVFVVFFMGLQSTFFSPAINGSIPENFAAGEVPHINALLKLATTATILLGIAMAGPFLDLPAPAALDRFLPSGDYAFGRLALGVFAVTVSIVGFIASLKINSRPPLERSTAPFPFLGPLHSIRHAAECRRKDRPLFLALSGEAFFYFFSSFVILCITNLGKAQLGLSMTVTSLLSVALMIGVCAGSLIAGRWPVQSWQRHVAANGLGMASFLLIASLCPYFPPPARVALLFILFAVTGAFGGMYLIPIVSFIQVRPAVYEKGKVLGISNFACFTGIMLSGPLFSFLLEPEITVGWNGKTLFAMQATWLQGLTPAMLMGGAGLATWLFMLLIRRSLKHCGELENLPGNHSSNRAQGKLPALADLPPGGAGRFLRAVLSLRYKIKASGLENIAYDPREKNPKPILFLPNHPALMDPLVVYSLLSGLRPRPLADEGRMAGLWGKAAGRLLKVVTIPDLGRVSGAEAERQVLAGLERLLEAMRQGDSILFYPAGRIYRSRMEALRGNSGLARLLERMPEARIVLVRTSGLWGSASGYAGARGNPRLGKFLLKGFLTLLGNLIFFTPRRKVEVEFVELTALPEGAKDAAGRIDKKLLNAWLEDFYNQKSLPAMGVPKFFPLGSKPYQIPEYQARQRSESHVADVPLETRQKVYAVLREAARLDETFEIREEQSLNADLDLDSLSMMEVVLKLEEALGVTIREPESLTTVGDCLLAVSGQQEEEKTAGKPVPDSWFAPAGFREFNFDVADGTIPDAFLALTRKGPREAVTAERSGVRNRRELLTAAMVLAGRIRALPGKRVGLMLPAVPAALGVWLAAMLAGKETVLLNWTVGEMNLRHCLKISETGHILTAGPLLDRLERQGLGLSSLPVEWIRLEKLAADLSLGEKLRGAWRARFTRSLKKYPVAETAAILFTSGSEAMPKGVPLTHRNLLINAADAIRALQVSADEKIVAMLPPFHSFGLLADMVLPLGFGLRAAFHPNPTEPAKISALIRDYRLTLLPATPTFLDAILERSKGTGNLDSLRFAFAGAEKCPEHVYRNFASACPQAVLCEGYGITECSPVVSVNRPGDAKEGTIGRALPSVSTALVREENGKITGPAKTGETGMLLVRGPSIFGGYLGGVASPFVEYDGQTWYRTGDLVSMDAEGRITFRGRLKRFVKIGGEMISLPQIENLLLEAFAGRPDAPSEGAPLAVEAGPEEHGSEITLFTPMQLELGEVNTALRKAGLSALGNVKRIVKIQTVPLLGTGKTDYRALKSSLV